MRVLHVITELSVGGAERVVVSLADGLAARGHEVAVAAGRPGLTELRAPDFEIAYVAHRPLRLLAAARDLRGVLGRWGPDVVHAHNPGMAAVVAAAMRTRRRGRVAALATVHGVADADLRRGARLLRASRLPVVACGPGVAASLREHGAHVEATILNGVAAAPPSADRRRLMASLRLDPALRLVVCVGRLATVKNQQLLVRAMAAVPGAALCLVGDGATRGQLGALAGQLGVAERVGFCGERADAREILGAADVVALPSRSEGLPLVALEALAAGRPLVATAVRGIRELVQDGETALLAPSDDVAAMAAALQRVLGDAALAARLSSAGRRLAAQHTVDRMVSDYLAAYDRTRRR